MDLKINVIKGPMFEKNIKEAQVYLAKIIKRKLDEGKYPTKSIS